MTVGDGVERSDIGRDRRKAEKIVIKIDGKRDRATVGDNVTQADPDHGKEDWNKMRRGRIQGEVVQGCGQIGTETVRLSTRKIKKRTDTPASPRPRRTSTRTVIARSPRGTRTRTDTPASPRPRRTGTRAVTATSPRGTGTRTVITASLYLEKSQNEIEAVHDDVLYCTTQVN